MRNDFVRVRCKPAFPVWLLLAVFGAGAVFILHQFSAPSTEHFNSNFSPLPYQIFGGALLLGVLIGVVYAIRTEIAADDLGIRWRGIGKWTEVRWDDVTDYYDMRYRKGNRSSVVKTRAGTLRFASDSWTHLNDLRALIVKRAASANAKEWTEPGDRDMEPWPLTFCYQSKPNLILLCVMGALGLYGTLAQWATVGPGVPKMLREMGPGWTLLMVSMVAFVHLSIWLLCALIMLPLGIEFHKRRSQIITADADGVTFEDGAERIRAAWDDVVEYYIVPRRAFQVHRTRQVITRNGTFEYLHVLQNCRILDNLIEKRAPEAVEKGASNHPDTSDELIVEKAPSGGERVFHYRRRSNRALIWFIWGAIIVVAVGGYASRIVSPTPLTTADILIRITVVGVVGIYFSWRFRTARIVTDGWGITQFGPFGKRTLPWGDVQAVREVGSQAFRFYVLRGTSTRIVFWFGISDLDALKVEIARRAPKLVPSGWSRRNEP